MSEPRPTDLYENCVYTIIDEDRLLAAERDGGQSEPIVVNGAWTRVESWFADARGRNLGIPILFADAKDVHRWLGWGLLVDLQVEKAGPTSRAKTLFAWDHLRLPLDQERSSLRLANTGQPLSDGHIRPYVQFKTPDFLRDPAYRDGKRLTAWLRTPAAVDYAIDKNRPDDRETTARTLKRAVNSLQSEVPGKWQAVVTPQRIRLYVGDKPDKDCLILDFDPHEFIWGLDRDGEADDEADGDSDTDASDEAHDEAIPETDGDEAFSLSADKFVALARKMARMPTEPSPQTLMLLAYCSEWGLPDDSQELDADALQAPLEMLSAWELAALEGNPALVHHFRRERSRELVRQKRKHMLQLHGHIGCEACGFRPDAVFPGAVREMCEVHHVIPLSLSSGQTVTRLEDLAVLCANCHRAIHALPELFTIDEFRAKYFPNRVGSLGSAGAS